MPDDDTPEELRRVNAEPWRLQRADQNWAAVNKRLNEVLDYIRAQSGYIEEIAGKADEARLFDFVHWMVTDQDFRNPLSHSMTRAFCAAALVRLVRAPRTDNDPLAQLERMIQENDDHS
jgi:hypothetical protein